MNVNSIIKFLEEELKLKKQEPWDNSGLQIGQKEVNINKIMLTLDMNMDVLETSIKENVGLIITHHPFFFDSIKKIDLDEYDGKIIKSIIENNISLYSIHTSFDMADIGITYALAEKLGISDYKVLHPVDINNSGYGGVSNISPINIIDFAKQTKKSLKIKNVKLYSTGNDRIVKRVAFCGGSGSEFIEDAIKLNTDVYVTSDIKYHQAQMAVKNNLCIIDAGHYNTEIHSMEILKEILEKTNLEILLYNKNMTNEQII